MTLGHSILVANTIYGLLLASSVDPDQTTEMCMLIWVFTVSICHKVDKYAKAHLCMGRIVYILKCLSDCSL